MINIIKEILGNINISDWKILENTIESKELFFIKKELDMNRSKEVRFSMKTKYGWNIAKSFLDR